MKLRALIVLPAALTVLLCEANAQMVTFDFDDAPLHSPLPVTLVSGGITGHFSSSSPFNNYSIQRADALGFTPVGFSGFCIYPSSIFASDLLIDFDQPLSDISLLYAPEEYATDSSCTMRISAYMGANFVGTNTYSIDPPGTWPTGTLAFSSAQTFDHVVVHYDQPPVTGGDYGPIFMVDNVVATGVPEPGSMVSMVLGLAVIAGVRRRAHFGRVLLVRSQASAQVLN